jgi:hypothetical protein
MRGASSYGRPPKLDRGTVERLKFKQEERLDQQNGTPGVWVQNGLKAALYIPNWMIQMEVQAQEIAARG